MVAGQAGKGDKRRPSQISCDDYYRNYETVFGKKQNWWETESHQKWTEEVRNEKQKLVEQESALKNKH